MRSVIKISLLAFCGLMAISSQAQEVKSFSLKEAQDYAVLNNFNSKLSQIDIEIAKKSVLETVSMGLPQVSAEVGYQDFLELPTSLIPAEFFGGAPGEFAAVQFGTKYNLTASGTLNQLLFDGSYIVGVQGAREFKNKMAQLSKKTEQDVRTDVEKAYLTVLIAQENKRLLEDNLGNIDSTLYETEKLYESGFLEESSVDQLKLLVATMKNNISRADRMIESTKKMLKFEMGINMDDKIEVSDKLTTLYEGVDAEALSTANFDVTKNIEYQLAETELILTNYLVKLEKAKYLPSLRAFLNYQQQAQRDQWTFFDGDKDWFPTTVWGVKLNIPIWDSFKTPAKVRQAQLNYMKVEEAKKYTEDGLKLKYETSRNDFQNAITELETSKEGLDLAQKIHDKTMIKYNEGVASHLDIMQTENQLLQNQASYISSLFELMKAKSELSKILVTY